MDERDYWLGFSCCHGVICLATAAYLSYATQNTQTNTPTPTVSPTTNPTANWKTYTNTAFGYTINYPPNYLPKPIAQDPDIKDSEAAVVRFEDPNHEEALEIVVREVPTNTILLEWVQENLEKNAKLTQSKIGSDEGYIVQYSTQRKTEESATPNEILLKHAFVQKDKENIIIISQYQPNFPIDRVISSFRFIEQTSTEGKFCGGIAAIKCPDGYYCKLSGNYPDAGGTCIQSGASKRVSPNPEQVVCTQDAKQCSDGSWVGRSGPNCEFVCPQ